MQTAKAQCFCLGCSLLSITTDMTKGDIPSYAYENFMEMYDAYHALGGNGMITKMKQEIEELHLKKKEV